MKSLVILLVMFFAAPCFGQTDYDGTVQPYVRYGSNPAARYVVNPPRLYSGGRYLGELSENRYRPDSVSNPHGRYGSVHSPDSINNPHGPYGRHSSQRFYIYQPRW